MSEQSRPDESADSLAGNRLRAARDNAGLGPDRVWREAGIPPRLLEMYERGVVPIRTEHAAALARCLDHAPTRPGGELPA